MVATLRRPCMRTFFGGMGFGSQSVHCIMGSQLAQLQYFGRWARADTLQYYLHEALTVKVENESRPEANVQLEFVLQHVALLQAPSKSVKMAEEPASTPGKRPVPRLSRAKGPAISVINPVAKGSLSAVDSTAKQLGDTEVDSGRTAIEILGDAASRANAARWRLGSVPRRIKAALARLMASLQEWSSTSPPFQRSEGLEPLQAVPGYPGAGTTRAGFIFMFPRAWSWLCLPASYSKCVALTSHPPCTTSPRRQHLKPSTLNTRPKTQKHTL